jgi:hypothetical protein
MDRMHDGHTNDSDTELENDVQAFEDRIQADTLYNVQTNQGEGSNPSGQSQPSAQSGMSATENEEPLVDIQTNTGKKRFKCFYF